MADEPAAEFSTFAILDKLNDVRLNSLIVNIRPLNAKQKVSDKKMRMLISSKL